ncbi:MAG: hypothetical protein VCD00_09285 [Candidatus Hydrogenedentota bacterium]
MLGVVYLLQLAKGFGIDQAPVAIAGSVLFAGGFTLHYRKRGEYSFVLALLIPIAVWFPVQFLAHPDVRLLTQNSELMADPEGPGVTLERTPPIVMVVFDEFPLIDLLDAQGDIDAKNFPNMARFAPGATWYENAATVATETMVAVPAILDGQWPGDSRLGIYAVHPHNLFALLQGQYALNLYESLTEMAPPGLERDADEESEALVLSHVQRSLGDIAVLYLHLIVPEEYTKSLPAIDEQWGGFFGGESEELEPVRSSEKVDAKPPRMLTPIDEIKGKLDQDRLKYFTNFVASIKDQPETTLHFFHALFPHRPYVYLPSGRIYADKGRIEGVGNDRETMKLTGEQVIIDRFHQGLRLQLGLADALLGELILELQRIGIYDESLIVIT